MFIIQLGYDVHSYCLTGSLIMSRVGMLYFFKQKTADEICACLGGWELCIRERRRTQLYNENP
ncbi:hypothetical protein DLS41_13595 [Staphylococcus pseudintermedius]|nr:hypothetical protein DLS41_13595 [Staphylococcus pseudintermedius]